MEPKPGTTEHIKWQEDGNNIQGIAEVIIGKQRHGPTGTVKLQFDGRYTRFGNLAQDQYLPERFE
jgi:replicative DNA helicase